MMLLLGGHKSQRLRLQGPVLFSIVLGHVGEANFTVW
jgi:hypothetical protein